MVNAKRDDEPEKLPDSFGTDAETHLAFYSSYIAVANSERETIWQRYSAMLIANSLVFAVRDTSTLKFDETIAATLFGLALCLAWWKLTTWGWEFFDIYSKGAAKFSFPGAPNESNPFREQFLRYIDSGHGDRIKRMALAVIALFAVAHLYFGLQVIFLR